MEDLLAKISSYNIFNNLIPGALFFILSSVTGLYVIEFKSVVLELSSYYVMGLVLSRIGSIAVEPLLKYSGLVKFASYQDYVRASRTDNKIDVLSESNNLYRTICSTLIVFLALYLLEYARENIGIDITVFRISLIAIVSVLFMLSYRKQTNYIRMRIESILRLERN